MTLQDPPVTEDQEIQNELKPQTETPSPQEEEGDPLESISFDLAYREVPFNIGPTKYVLKEASEAIVAAWQDQLLSSAVIRDGKAQSVKNIGKSEAFLLGMCVFKEGSEAPVGMDVVLKWPHRIRKKLSSRLEKISELDMGKEKKDKTAKNEQDDTPTGF